MRSMAGTAESRTSAVSDRRFFVDGAIGGLSTRMRRGCDGSFFGCFLFFIVLVTIIQFLDTSFITVSTGFDISPSKYYDAILRISS